MGSSKPIKIKKENDLQKKKLFAVNKTAAAAHKLVNKTEIIF